MKKERKVFLGVTAGSCALALGLGDAALVDLSVEGRGLFVDQHVHGQGAHQAAPIDGVHRICEGIRHAAKTIGDLKQVKIHFTKLILKALLN